MSPCGKNQSTMNQKNIFVLASESPRRKQLLEDAGFSFTVFPIKVSEILQKNLNAEDQIIQISEKKWIEARTAWNAQSSDESLILTADTMVVFNHNALGKPENELDARSMLENLSGNVHFVITAISLGKNTSEKPVTRATSTEVWFRTISRQEILDYIRTQEPMDKAGSYAIQGLGGKFVEKFVGPYDNVVGLPVETLKKVAQENGWKLPTQERNP